MKKTILFFALLLPAFTGSLKAAGGQAQVNLVTAQQINDYAFYRVSYFQLGPNGFNKFNLGNLSCYVYSTVIFPFAQKGDVVNLLNAMAIDDTVQSDTLWGLPAVDADYNADGINPIYSKNGIQIR